VAEAAAECKKLRTAANFFAGSRCAAVFRSWQHTAASRRENRAKAAGFLRKLRSRDLAAAFAQWLDSLQDAMEVRRAAAQPAPPPEL